MKKGKEYYKLRFLTKKEMLVIYRIINDETIDANEKAEMIEEFTGDYKRFMKSLDYKFYEGIDKELEEMRQWHDNTYIEEVKESKRGGSGYSKEKLDKKLDELAYFVDMYKQGKLNENTIYPYFEKLEKPSYGINDNFAYFNGSATINFRNPEMKELMEILPEVCKELRKLTTGTSLENLRYRKSIERKLEKNLYLENYLYAEFLIKNYIEDSASYYIKDFFKKYSTNEEEFKYCIETIRFLNLPLYKEFVAKHKENGTNRVYATNMTFVTLAKQIIECRKNGTKFPVTEYLRQTPFKDSESTYLRKIEGFIQNGSLKNTIVSYIIENNLTYFKEIDLEKQLEKTEPIKGVVLSKTDTENIYKIIRAYNLPWIDRVYYEVLKSYISGNYNMDEVNEIYETIEDKKEEIVQNPYILTPVIKKK